MSIPLLILALVGLLMYVFMPGKYQEVGRIIFFCALLALCMGSSGPFQLRFR